MKKFDYIAQSIIIFAIVLLSLLYFIDNRTLFFPSFLLLVLGVWQLISALVQTTRSVFKIYKKQIRIYWVIAGTSLLLLGSGIVLVAVRVDSNIGIYAGVASMFVGLAAAIYYLYIYKTCFLAATNNEPKDSNIRPV